MTLDEAAFTPLSEAESNTALAPKKSPDRVPIVPVPDDAPECGFRIPSRGGAPKRMWAYRDAAGRLLGYDARFEYEVDGKAAKDVMPIAFCQVGDKLEWRSKALPAPRPLYGLDRLAERPDAPVVIAEGCKSADAAALLLPDHVAISWQGGGNATGLSSWLPLAGRDVLIWPDRDRQCELSGAEKAYEDQPGTITACNIVEKLRRVASSIRLLDLSALECKGGWDAADAVEDGWTPTQAQAFVEQHAGVVDTEASGTIMPFQFEYGTDGLYFVEGETKRHKISGRLKVIAKTRDLSGSGWGLLLEWRDGDGARHLWSMPMSMLAGDGGAVREELLARGLYVSTESKNRTKLMHFLSAVDTPVRARAVTSVGWAGKAFVLPHQAYGDTPSERVMFQSTEVPTHQYLAAGTLKSWQDNVASLAVGNSRVVFAIACAFVGPILAPAMEEGGGVNLVGSSSSGKTTCMIAAASVWGPPKFMRTWRATGNGLEGIAAQHSETFLALDELGQIDPNEAGAVAYMLANGQGKSRATRSGASRAATGWNILYLSTGEVGLGEIARQSRRGNSPAAGQEVRILDVSADAGCGLGAFEKLNGGAADGAAFSRLIKTASGEHYGVASEAYLSALVERKAEAGDFVARTVQRFLDKAVTTGSDGQVQRGARRFGLIAAAGELAIKVGVLPWRPGEVIEATSVMFSAWVARRGGTGSAEERNIIAQFRKFFEAHAATRFDAARPEDGGPMPVRDRAGWWEDVRHGHGWEREYWLPTEQFKNISAGFDHATVVAALESIGALKPGADGKSSQRRKPTGMPQLRVHVIGSKIFEVAPAQEAELAL